MDQQHSPALTPNQLRAIANYWYWQGYVAGAQAAALNKPALFTHN